MPAKSKAKKTKALTGMAKTKAKPPLKKNAQGVVLLSGGNPQIKMGEGDAPVQAYIAAMPEWKQDIGKRLDKLIEKTVPGVHKAVKWNSPMYGVPGQGFFVSFHVFAKYVKVTFFRGAQLTPLPPDPSKDKNTRYVNVRDGELDEKQMASWIKQAAAIPGWIPGQP